MNSVINSNDIKKLFEKSTDVLVRQIHIHNDSNIKIHLFCVDGMVNSELFDLAIIEPLSTAEVVRGCKDEQSVFNYMLEEGGAYHAFATEIDDREKMITMVMSGMVALIFNDLKKALVLDIRAFDKRSVQEPSEEGVMKGAKDSFIEVLRTNTALIRRRIRSPYLVVEQMYVGNLSRTDVALVYISNICDMELVNKLRNILQKIELDNIAAAGFIEEFIVEDNQSLFPQVMYTQRPDRCSSNLTDGRVALVIDGVPFVYLLPCQLPMLMQSPEDYSENYLASSALRFLRYFTMIVSLLLPAFYIAVTTFHNQLLPVQLVLSIQQAKVNVPFSSWIEVLGLLFSFEILIEAGLRLPKTVGQAMSIVGGLVVGQAAVEANIISPAVVIIVALTGIAGFTIPNQDLAIAVRVSRFVLAVLAALAGFYGMIIGITFAIIHLCSLESFGIAYLAPFVDDKGVNLRDTLFRFPIKDFKFRPERIAKKNRRKQR